MADTGNHRIVWLRWNPNNEVLSWLGVVSTTAGVVDLEVDKAGQVWAVDAKNNKITKYTSDLLPLCTFGNGDFVPNRFYVPWSISNTGGYLGYGNMFVGEAWTDSSGGQYFCIGTDIVDFYVTSTPDERWQYIHYVLIDPSITCIKIQNVQSRVGRTLRHGLEMSGEGCYTWEGADDSGRQVASGYYYIMVADTCTYYNIDTGLPSNNVTRGGWVYHAQNPTLQYTPGDANDDGAVNVGDAVYLINFIFKEGPAPRDGCT